MPNNKIELFDTTLRDGTQGERVSFSVEDKIHIAQRLDDFCIDFIEGGWPGSNPRDINFFQSVKSKSFKHSKIVAFGSTRHKSNRVDNDPNLKAMLEAETPAVSIFGKSWLLHVETALKADPEENLKMIEESVVLSVLKAEMLSMTLNIFLTGTNQIRSMRSKHLLQPSVEEHMFSCSVIQMAVLHRLR